MHSRTTTRRRRNPGFSLLELMLVLAILGILMSVAAINVLGAGARAKARATRASMETIKGALSQYNMEHSIYPPTLDTLKTGGFLEKGKPLKDGWGRDFVYNPQGRDKDRPFILGSSGENGQTGDEDDIDVWTMHEKNN